VITDAVVELGVKVTEQLPPVRVQLAGVLKVPAPPVEAKLTEPAGVVAPVAPLVSATVATQVEAVPIATEAGVQTTVVEVVRLFTVSDWVANPVPTLLVAVTLTVKVPDNA
jgi:hypothetical protein